MRIARRPIGHKEILLHGANMSVLVDVEVPIVTTGRTGSARKLQIIETQIIRQVEIQQVGERDAPLALTFRRGEYRFRDGQFFLRIGKWHGSRNYCRMDWFRGFGPLVRHLSYRAFRDELVSELGERRVVNLTAGIVTILDQPNPQPLPPVKAMDMARVEVQLREFDDVARALILVGDAIYCPVERPVLTLYRPQNAPHPACLWMVASLEEVPPLIRRNDGLLGVYSLADFEQASSRAMKLAKGDHGSTSTIHDDRLVVHDTSMFDLDCLALNAVIFATMFNDDFYYRRPSWPGLLELETERSGLFDRIRTHLVEYFATGLTDPLIDVTAEIVDMPLGDPFWKMASHELIEQREFMCNRFDNVPIAPILIIPPF